MVRDRFEVHAHTEYSNLRLLDSINKPKALIDRAIEMGLKGIAITDHECLSSHIKVNQYMEELQKTNPNFKVALGNEIYLVKERKNSQRYYHFLLMAKNKLGYKALKELSSRAWMLSYHDRGMKRVPTLYDELSAIVKKYPGTLIATTACLGGELSSLTATMIEAERIGDTATANDAHQGIVDFVLYCKDLFGQDFYIECAPGASEMQIMVNERLVSIAQAFDVKMVIGSDAHYLDESVRFAHEAFLNSKEGEREVASFYQYAYLQTEKEIFKNLRQSGYEDSFIEQMYQNSMEIYDKISYYSLFHNQEISTVEIKEYPKNAWWGVNNDYADEMSNFPVLKSLFVSDDPQDRYWVNQCFEGLENKVKPWYENIKYVKRLEEEARVQKTVGEKLGTNILKYPVTFQHYIDLIWNQDSTVGAGRGSSCSGLNHYLLGITQLDPVVWNLPYYRFLNEERIELPDIDVDVSPEKRPVIIKKIKEERQKYFYPEIDALSKENLGCTGVATFGTLTTKAVIQTACRGYRSEEYPMGIDVDVAQYISSLIPAERGFLWSLNDVINGNPEKGRKPVQIFLNEIKKYPGFIDILLNINGLITQLGSHASGFIFFEDDPYDKGCFMTTPGGEIITQWDLHDSEWAGMTKYDLK